MNLHFILPSGRVVTISERKVKSIVTTRLSNLFYWRFMDDIRRDDIMSFFDRKANFNTVKKICWYILFYAENLVFSVYLMLRGDKGKLEAERYLSNHKPLLERLRELYKNVNRDNYYDVAGKMIDECLKYGIDPF